MVLFTLGSDEDERKNYFCFRSNIKEPLLVAFGILPKNFGRWRRPMNGTLEFYECRLSGGDTETPRAVIKFVTVRISSGGKVRFSQASVILSTGGGSCVVKGGGACVAGWDMCGEGVCMAGGHVWHWGCVCGGGCAWQESVHGRRGMCGRRDGPLQQTVRILLECILV